MTWYISVDVCIRRDKHIVADCYCSYYRYINSNPDFIPYFRNPNSFPPYSPDQWLDLYECYNCIQFQLLGLS